jgi:peptide/nickel transport system ATP-binding protein
MTAKSDKKVLKEIKRFNNQKYRDYNKYLKRKRVPENEYITVMKDPNNILEIDNLQAYFYTDIGTVKAVDGVTFDVPMGKTIGVVGESGCGKSVTGLSIMRLLQSPQGQITGGEIRLNQVGLNRAVNIPKMPLKEVEKIRGKEIAMIFQEPMTSLNPVFTIGDQIDEIIELHNPNMNKNEVKARTIEMLNMVGIPRAEGVYKNYPHELSGGMRQRVMIAMALSCNPRLIIADEPTTALDVTIQAQILDLLVTLKEKINSSIMLITHDLGVVAEVADIVVVMYAGRDVEQGTAEEIFYHPSHPYTLGLMKSRPSLNADAKRLYSIPGNVPNPINMPNHCYYRNRCEFATAECGGVYPPMIQLSETHKVCCYNPIKGNFTLGGE